MRELLCSQPESASFNSLLILLIGENPNSETAHQALLDLLLPSLQVSALITAPCTLGTPGSPQLCFLKPPCFLILQSKCSSPHNYYHFRCPCYVLREFVAFLAKPEGRCNINFLHSPLFLARLHRIGK